MVNRIVVQQTARKVGGGILKNLGFLTWFKVLAIILFFLLPIGQGIVMGLDAKSVTPFFEHLTPIFLTPTLVLQETSNTIILQEGLIPPDLGFFNGIWQAIIVIWKIWQSLWIIFKWIWLLSWAATKILIQDDSKTTAGYTVGTAFFFLFQIIFLFFSAPENLSVSQIIVTPFRAIFWDFPHAILAVLGN